MSRSPADPTKDTVQGAGHVIANFAVVAAGIKIDHDTRRIEIHDIGKIQPTLPKGRLPLLLIPLQVHSLPRTFVCGHK